MRVQPTVRPNSVRQRLASLLQTDTLLASLMAGLVIGTIEVMIIISYSALIFSGPLAADLATGFGLILMTGVIVLLVISLTGSLPGVIGSVQDSPSALLAVMAATLASTLAARGEAPLATVIASFVIASSLTGVFLLLLGIFKKGDLVRFIPYPVTGGFLAGTGWLLLLGGFDVLAGVPASAGQIIELFDPAALPRWLPSLAFAALLLWVLRRREHFLILPGFLLGAGALFYLVMWLSGSSLAAAQEGGWLLEAMPGRAGWQPLATPWLLQANWSLILSQAGQIATILVVCALQLLLNARGIELAAEADVDLDRELRAAGIANILAGLAGGAIGYQTLSLSSLSRRMGARSRFVGVAAAAVCVAVLLLGSSMLAYIPRPVAGMVLLLLGLSFLTEWVIDARRQLPTADYAIVLLILLVIAVVGVLPGVAIGLGIAVALFVVRYSRIDVIKHAFSARSYASTVERPEAVRAWLRERGEQIHILELQGFIFFGTADHLLDSVRQQLARGGEPPVRFVVLDFRRVTGLDSSAALSFTRMCQLVEKHGAKLLLTSVPATVREQLSQGGITEQARGVKFFASLDHGVEWCEELLFTEQQVQAEAQRNLREHLAGALSSPAHVDVLLSYMERREVICGECLIRQGEPSQGVYFIESGEVTIQLEMDTGEPVRLRTMKSGTIVGELGFYLGTPATASVMMEATGSVSCLSPAGLKRLEAEQPAVATDFHRYMANLLAHRLSDTTYMLRTVMN